MTLWLQRLGYPVNHKRVERLMHKMGLRSVAPGPHTSKPAPEHVKYPYLLRDVQVTKPNQAWCSDITYIPMKHGFMYLVAVMDWHSRFILSWELWRSLKYENVYPHRYETPVELYHGLDEYFMSPPR